MIPLDPATLSLPESHTTEPSLDPSPTGYFIDPYDWSLIIEDEDLRALDIKVRKNAQELSRLHLVPDLFAGPYTEDMPWPRRSDFDALLNASTQVDFWDFLAENDPRMRNRRGQLTYTQEFHRSAYAILAMAVARDIPGAYKWAAQWGSRSLDRPLFLKGIGTYYQGKLGKETRAMLPSVPTAMDSCALYIASAAPGRIYPTDISRIQKFSIPKHKVSGFTSAREYGIDVMHSIKDAYYMLNFKGARKPTFDSSTIQTTLVASQGGYKAANQEEYIYPIKLSQVNGDLIGYVFVNIFFETQGVLPHPQYSDKDLETNKNWKSFLSEIENQRKQLEGLKAMSNPK